MKWGTVAVFGGDPGDSYPGARGDRWDARKVMALASLGALFTMVFTAAVNWRLQRDFAWQWVDSFGVEHKALSEAVRMAEKKK